jgi:hypothetical protein
LSRSRERKVGVRLPIDRFFRSGASIMRLPPNRTLFWLLLWLGASALGSIAIVLAARALVPLDVLLANNEVAGNYLQTLGTVYAVLLAFVVFVVWNQYNEARNHVEAEANEIADLYRTVHGLPDPCRSRIRARLRDYVRAVVDREWSVMARGRSSARAAALLEKLWHALECVEPASNREQSLYDAALARFNDLSDSRTHRLLSSRIRLPMTMWLLLLVGAALTVGSMALFGIERLLPHALMAASLGSLVCFVLFVIYDLDNPFWGDWCISSEPIARAIDGQSTDRKPKAS